MTVWVGLLLPSRDAAAAGNSDVHHLVDLAVRAEELGFDSVWVGDSPIARPRADAVALLAAISAQTERVALGTAVLLAALRDPVLLAHQLATLDRLSDGRLIAGIGSGFPYPPTRGQFEAVGVDYGSRTRRTEETVAAMRALWTAQEGSAIAFEGEQIRFEGVRVSPRPARPGGPPIWYPFRGSGSGGQQ